MSRTLTGVFSVLVFGVCLTVAGCARAPVEAPAAAPVAVTVSYPVERDVTDYADFTGRTAAVDSVEVRAHVSGYLDTVNFKEGALVKKNDKLFEIDPRPYQAELERAKGTVAQCEARVHRLERDFQRQVADFARGGRPGRIRPLRGRLPGGGGQPRCRQGQSRPRRAERGVRQSNSAGQRSRQPVRRHGGQPDPVRRPEQRHTCSPPSCRSTRCMSTSTSTSAPVLRIRQLIREGKAKSAGQTRWPVALGLATEEGFPHQGTINFEDNQVNPKTGTLRVRGVFPNKDEALSPGFFARVRVPIGQAHHALLVTDRAIDTDQGEKILYIVNKKHEVVSRPVRLGALHYGLREITAGLEPGEQVIVNGLQQVRPGITVEPKFMDMPVRLAASGHKSEKL